jgi:hypothetical protein
LEHYENAVWVINWSCFVSLIEEEIASLCSQWRCINFVRTFSGLLRRLRRLAMTGSSHSINTRRPRLAQPIIFLQRRAQWSPEPSLQIAQ